MEMQRISATENTRRYGAAILAALAALLLYKLLSPAFGGQYPYHTAWAAVAFSAWYCGVGPSFFAICIYLIGIWYWFLPKGDSFRLANPERIFPGCWASLPF